MSSSKNLDELDPELTKVLNDEHLALLREIAPSPTREQVGSLPAGRFLLQAYDVISPSNRLTERGKQLFQALAL